MLGKLTWNAIPWDQPIPLISASVVFLFLIGVIAWIILRGPFSLSLARVDYERGP